MLRSDDPISDAIARGMSALRAGRGDEALAAFGDAEVAARAAGDDAGVSSALRHSSLVWRQRSDWERAAALARRAADVAREAGLREPLAEALNAEAIVHQSRGNLDDAIPLLEESVRIAAERRTVAVARGNLGFIAAQRGDLQRARAHFMEAARSFREAGYAFGEASALNNFGRSGLDSGNARVALPMLEDALGASKRAGDAELTAIVRRNLAEAYGMLGHRAEGRAMAEEALDAFTAEGNEARRAECLRILGELAAAEGERALAEKYLHEAYSVAAASDARAELDRIAARISSGASSA